jgi:hypothetical protein
MTRGVWLAVVLVTALAAPARAQEKSGAGDLKVALTNLRAVAFPPRDLGPSQPRLVAATQWLNNNYDRSKPSEISEEYARTIAAAAELLQGRPSPEIVEDVAAELEAKVEHCRRLGVGMGGSVTLRVDTRRGAEPIGNWQVLYLLKIYERLSTKSPSNFPRLSTPTERPLEPGRYWIWARNPATGQLSDRALVTVAGEKHITVDLAVP